MKSKLIKTSEYLFHWYGDLCTEILLKKNSDSNSNNQDHEGQNFTVKKYRWSKQQCERKNSLMIEQCCKKFVFIFSVDEFILEHENKNNITFK